MIEVVDRGIGQFGHIVERQHPAARFGIERRVDGALTPAAEMIAFKRFGIVGEIAHEGAGDRMIAPDAKSFLGHQPGVEIGHFGVDFLNLCPYIIDMGRQSGRSTDGKETTMKFYAAHNAYADINKGSRGFLNTWEISRFSSRSDRDAFVEKYQNKDAKPVTRKAAIELFAGNYLSVGKVVPVGGLFGRFGQSNFWNELYADA
jgi:hypothetical protein